MSEILVNSLKTAGGVGTLTFDSTGDVLLTTGRIGRVAGNTITIDSDGILNAASVNVSSAITLPSGAIDSAAIGTGAVSANKIASGAVEGAMTTQIGGRRNLIINGAMQVAQRGDSSSVSTTTYGGPDRWRFAYEGSSSVWTLDHSTTSPEGFSNSYKLLCTTADGSQDASSQVAISQRIEAQDLQQLSYGASGAKSLTLSFWVRSNQTGTYAVHLYSQDGGRIIGSTYAISAADTWEYKTITFAGDTSGTINNDNGIGLEVKFFVSAGSTYRSTDNTSWGAYADGKIGYGQTVDLADTLNNEWYITGVQLEVGTVATPFEHRSYGEELALCQRYYQYILKTCRLDVYRAGGTSAAATLNYATEMRSTPTLALTRHSTIYGPVNTGAGTSGLEGTDTTNVSTGLYVYTSGTGVQVGVNCTVIAESEL